MTSRKMILLPEDQLSPTLPAENFDTNDAMDVEKRGRKPKDAENAILTKLWKAINIVLKLHTSSMVDTSGQLLDSFGKPVAHANLVNLIHYSLSKGRARVGENEYVSALHKARVPIEWLVNQDTISKYLQIGKSKPILEPEQPRREEQGTPPPPPLVYYGPTSSNSEPLVHDDVEQGRDVENAGPIRTETRDRPAPYARPSWQKKDGQRRT